MRFDGGRPGRTLFAGATRGRVARVGGVEGRRPADRLGTCPTKKGRPAVTTDERGWTRMASAVELPKQRNEVPVRLRSGQASASVGMTKGMEGWEVGGG